MVILFHTLFAVHLAFREDPAVFQQFLHQFPNWLQFVFGFDKAVDIFFMISAYLLGSSLKKQAASGHLTSRRFYIQRMGRIYPLFLLGVLVYGLPTGEYFLEVFWHNLLFIDNYTFTTLIPVGWSLSVEMQCYLLLPFLVMGLNKTKAPIKWLFLLIGASISLRWGITLFHPETVSTMFTDYLKNIRDPAEYMRRLYESTPGRAGSFIIGLLWAYSESTVIKKLNSRFIANGLFIVLLTVLVFSMKFPVYLESSDYYLSFNQHINQIIVVGHRYVFCFSLLGMILLMRSQPELAMTRLFYATLSAPFWRPFSKLAFPAYLFHFPFIAISWVLVMGTTNIDTMGIPSIGQAALVFLLTSIFVIWFSLPLHYKIELPGIRLGKFLANRWGRQLESNS